MQYSIRNYSVWKNVYIVYKDFATKTNTITVGTMLIYSICIYQEHKQCFRQFDEFFTTINKKVHSKKWFTYRLKWAIQNLQLEEYSGNH